MLSPSIGAAFREKMLGNARQRWFFVVLSSKRLRKF
jgi:hypothetical protein